MFVEIEGSKIERELFKEAKALLKANGNPSCVCLAIKRYDAKRGGTMRAYYGFSGQTGRDAVRASFNADAVDLKTNWSRAEVDAVLQVMADGLVKYRSGKDGAAVQQRQNWSTHNCAESNLALYLFKQGKQLGDYMIASYELNGETCDYKPLCNNCVQWCRNAFKVLPDFESKAG